MLLRVRWVRTAAAFAISGVLLWFAMRALDTHELVRVLRSASLSWIGVSLAFYWLEVGVRAVRWRMLLRPLALLAPGQVLLAIIVGYAANNALPARLGELFRADFIGKRHGLSRFAAMATIMIERLLDVLAVVGCAAAGVMALAAGRGETGFAASRSSIIEGLAIAVLIALVFLGVLYGLLVYGRSAAKLRSAQLRWAVSALAEGLRPIGKPGQLVPLIGPSTLVWVLNGLSMTAMLMAVGIFPSAAAVVLLIGVAGFAAALPAAPGNIGTLQFAFVVALGASGYPDAQSFAAATLVQVFLLGSVTLAGAVLYSLLPYLAPSEHVRGSH